MSTLDAPRAGSSIFWGPEKTANELEAVPTVRALKSEHPHAVLRVSDFRGDLSITIRADDLLLVAQTLKIHPELQYDMLLDICGMDDLLLGRSPRFRCVYHFYSTIKKKRVRITVPLDAAKPSVDSLTPLYKAANWA